MQDTVCPRSHGLISPEDCLLLIVDVQERLLPAIHGWEALQENIVRLLRFARIQSMPIMGCEQVKLGGTVTEIAAEIPDFQPIAKETFNCFGSSEFRSRLRARQKNILVIAGIEAHVCVLQTAISGVQEQGYRVQVIMDATASRSPHNLQLARERFWQTGVEVSSVETFVFECLQRAGTAAFRTALPLIK